MNNMSDKYDYGYNKREATRGCGTYVNRAYAPTITNICEVDGILLRTVESLTVKYEILWDGKVLNTYPNLKTAETYFIDFAGITRNKYNKMRNKAA